MSQRQKNNNVFAGVVLIFLAVYVIFNKLIDLPGIPVFKILFTCFLGYAIYKGVKKRNYPMIFIPGALILWQYDSFLGIEAITPGAVLFAAVLLSVGFNLLSKDHIVINKKEDMPVVYDSNQDGMFADVSYNPENGKIVIDNGLGSTTRYITEQDLEEVKIDNGLGSCVVYFQGCTMKNNILKVNVDNGLGSTSIYCPKEWSINLVKDNGLGTIQVKGDPSSDPAAPCLDIFVDNGLGAVEINFI